MLKIQVADGVTQIEASGSFKNILIDLADIQRKIYDALPDEAQEDMLKIYTDPEYWKIVLKEKHEAIEGRRMRWIMEP